MKSVRIFSASFVILFFGILLLISACQKNEHFQATFPLSADEVTKLLEKSGLQGEISENETESRQDGRISYVIRNAAETYTDSENGKLVANVVSLTRKDGRALSVVFNQSVLDEAIVWTDWERQIRFASLLYGGFEDEEALYRACMEAQQSADRKTFSCKIELPDGYCIVSYNPYKSKTYDENDYEIVNYSAFLRVNIYESRNLYEHMNAELE